MIDRSDKLPVVRQCELLRLSRSSVYYVPQPVSEGDLALMRRIDELHLNHPFAGARMLRDLLRGLEIAQANHVWAMDITYIPMRKGFVYLAAVLDWATRRVLSWRLSNSLTTDFCIEALEKALQRHGKPEIFNTDQAASSPARSSSI